MDASTPAHLPAGQRTGAHVRAAGAARRAVAALGVVAPLLAAVLVFGMAASAERTVGPVAVRAELAPALDGIATLAFPPFGAVAADTHAGPVDVTLTLTSVDIEALTTVASAGQPEAAEVAEWLARVRGVVATAVLRGLLAALLTAAVVAMALGRSLRRVVTALGMTAVVLAVPGAIAGATFDQRAFAEPRFEGALSHAPAAFGLVQQRLTDIEALQRQVGSLASDLASYYGVPQSLVPGGTLPGTYRVLHVSDLHLDPVGMQLVLDLASAYDVEFIIDTGDITHFGTAQEAALAAAQLGSKPYVFVPGNHDSPAIAAALALDPRVTVLDGETTVTARGLAILGIGDPAGSGSDVEPDPVLAAERGAAAASVVERRVAAGEEPPDVVAVHDPAAGMSFAGLVGLVLSGHSHTPSLEVVDGTVFVGAGTTGGVHFTELRPDPHIPNGAAVLYFSIADPGRLVAIDQIEVHGKSRQSAIRRTIVDEAFLDD